MQEGINRNFRNRYLKFLYSPCLEIDMFWKFQFFLDKKNLPLW